MGQQWLYQALRKEEILKTYLAKRVGPQAFTLEGRIKRRILEEFRKEKKGAIQNCARCVLYLYDNS